MIRYRIGLVVATTAAGLAGFLALSACGTPATGSEIVQVASVSEAEGDVLANLGVPDAELAAAPADDPAPAATASPASPASRDGHRARRARALLRHNTLHGEATVRTKDGVKTLVGQRGTVTAVDGDSVTVKSTDGFTQTWKFGEKLRVVDNRAKADKSKVVVGKAVAVAGHKDGSTATAGLIVIPATK
jgi:hypothetical protein